MLLGVNPMICFGFLRILGEKFGQNRLLSRNVGNPRCNTPKYTLVVFDMFRVFCKHNLTVS